MTHLSATHDKMQPMNKLDSSAFSDLLAYAVARNFGGQPEMFQDILRTYLDEFDPSYRPESVPIMTLIIDNLKSENSRHLMLLTKNGTALPLLFESGILDPNHSTILIGSGFEDDQAELHLVKQINDVKLAMLRGDTCVLVNHDNIYEALYDVLNQRYLFQTNRRTGEVKKMLRLAIGSRSQLCQVHPKFKIVVIVEQEHAYNKLDLPLLNRFEKQVLTATDLLSVSQKNAVDELKTWCQRILDQIGCDENYQNIFCGFYDGTLSSAVLQVTQAEPYSPVSLHHIDEIKRWLVQIATPVAYMHSDLLRSAGNSDKLSFNHGPASRDFAQCLNDNLSKSSTDAMLVVLTHSPLSHLSSRIDSSEPATNIFSTPIDIIQLATIPSEAMLVKMVENFLRKDVDHDTTLLIQCDVLMCSQSLINHSQHICWHKHRVIRGESRSSMNDTRRNIVFLIHLPPGIANRARNYTLDFHHPWTYRFIDDLRPHGDACIASLVEASAAELADNGVYSLEEMVHSSIQAALAECIVPSSIDENVCSYVNRVRQFRSALSDSGFRDRIMLSVREILNRHREVDANGMHVHVKLATIEVYGGSFRQSLMLGIQLMVKRALAATLRYLDGNFNLITFAMDPKLWLDMCDCRSVFDPMCIASTAHIGVHQTSSTVNMFAKNEGRHAPLISQFPWSVQIMKLLDTPSTREAIMQNDKCPYDQLRKMCNMIYTPAVVEQWNAYSIAHPDAYLHDFVNAGTPTYPNLPFEIQLQLYRSVLRVARGTDTHDPISVQVAVWLNSERLFRLCSLCSGFHPDDLDWFLERFNRAVQMILRNEDRTSDAERLSTLEVGVVNSVIKLIWTRANDVLKICEYADHISSKVPEYWTQVGSIISCVSTDVEAFLSALDMGGSSKICIDTLRVRKEWTSVLLLRIFIDELTVYFNVNDWSSLLDNFRKPKPYSRGYLLRLIGITRVAGTRITCGSKLEENSIAGDTHDYAASCTANFLRRYITDVLFSTLNRPWGVVDYSKLSPALLEELHDIVTDRSGFVTEQFPITSRISLRRAVFQCLLDGDVLFSRAKRDPVSAQMYIEYELTLVNAHPLSADEIHAATLDWNAISALDDRQYQITLRQLARCITRIRSFINRLLFGTHIEEFHPSEMNKGKAEDACEEHEFYALPSDLKALLSVPKSSLEARVYACKLILRLGGVDSLYDMTLGPIRKFMSWLPASDANDVTYRATRPVDTALLWGNVAKQDDNMNKNELTSRIAAFEDLYRELSTSIRRCMNGSTTHLKTIIETHSRNEYESLMVYAVINEVYFPLIEGLGNTSLNPKNIYNFFPHQSIGRRFATAITDERWVTGFMPQSTVTQRQLLTQLAGTIVYLATEHMIADKRFGKPSGSRRVDTSTTVITCVNSFWMALLTNPSLLVEHLIPGMPESEYATISSLLSNPGWYKCPNGHVYTVGECTQPMERSTCPDCGAPIGGERHTSVAGVSKVDIVTTSSKGYILRHNPDGSEPDDGDIRLPPLCKRILRLLIHLSLRVAIEIEVEPEVMLLLRKAFAVDDSSKLKMQLDRVIQFDWTDLRRQTALSDSDLSLVVHLVLREAGVDWGEMAVGETDGWIGAMLTTSQGRLKMEQTFENAVNRVLKNPECANRMLQEFRTTGIMAQRVRALTQIYSERTYQHIEESDISSPLQYLWRFVEPVSFDNFTSAFQSSVQNMEDYPLLATFMSNEKRLPILHSLSSILEWHSILFEVFPNNSISRVEAGEITNRQAIEQLPEDRQSTAHAIFSRYAAGFNRALPLLENLYECQTNPFLSSDKMRVDLSGMNRSGDSCVPMGLDIPVNFSLPSMIPGETDAPGLCTIQLLNLMQTTYNELFGKLVTEPSKQSGISINYRTSARVLRERTIQYDRESDMMPLVLMASKQGLEYGGGGHSQYSFGLVEDGLRSGLLAGCEPLIVQVIHFHFRGELQKTGQIMGLRARIAQKNLPGSVLDTISTEIDTQEHAKLLMIRLETGIAFLATIGGDRVKNMDGQLLLSDYMVNSLLLDKDEWSMVSSKTIDSRVRLCHVQALFLHLEELMHGSPLDNVHENYRVPATPELADALSQSASQMDLSILIVILRDFLIERLINTNLSPDAHLKEYLGYCDADLPYLDWYDGYFPELLQLKHTLHTFQILSSLTGKT